MQATYLNVQPKGSVAKRNLVPLLPGTDAELRLVLPVTAKRIQLYSHTISAVAQVDPNPLFFNPSTDKEYEEVARICGMPKQALKIKHKRILKGQPLVVYRIVRVSLPQELRFLGTFAGQLQRLNYIDARDLSTLPVAPIEQSKEVGIVLSHTISLGKNNWVALRTHSLSKFNKKVVREFENAFARQDPEHLIG